MGSRNGEGESLAAIQRDLPQRCKAGSVEAALDQQPQNSPEISLKMQSLRPRPHPSEPQCPEGSAWHLYLRVPTVTLKCADVWEGPL